ncbi:MAG: peptidoglycan DD-metalloendopeptidase family protein, partial [Caldilineaceae bacterium]|nr:peptidoglycan DD-metalloendopeptidase family protein [Caldilineaceae bacterium]
MANHELIHGLTSGMLGWPFAPDETWEITQYFGQNGHIGVDWGCARGTPIYAVAPGTVTEIKNTHHLGYHPYVSDDLKDYNGNFVRVTTNMDGIDFQHVYLHLQPGSVVVKKGEEVKPYQLLGLAGNTGNSTNAHLDLTFKAKSGHGGRYNTFFDSLHFLDHHRRRALEKHAYQGPKLQVDSTSPVALKNMPDGVDGTVMAQPEVWYDIVGQAADNWWQIVVPHGKPNQEDVGWVAVADDRKIKGELTWVHNTDPELTDPDVLRPPNAPPTMLRSFSYIPGIHTLTWAAPAADGITGYRIQSSTGGNPVTAVADTGSTATQWISSAVEPCYRVFYRVAALRGNQVGQWSNLLPVPLTFLRLRFGATAAEPVRQTPVADQTVVTYLQRGDRRCYPIVGRLLVNPLWWQIRLPDGSRGWVLDSAVTAGGDLAAVQGWAPELRVSSWVTLGLHLRSGPGKAYDPPLQTLRDHGVWHRIVGKDATHPTWWRIRVSTNSHGWVHAGHVDTRGDLSGVPVQDAASPLPAETGSSGEAAQGTSTTSGAASGPYRNLETNPEGRWSVTKTGTEVTARFSSPRSPVQYYARQNPQPQFVLPVGFRPTVAKAHEATGTHVHEDRTEYDGSPTAKFDLTIGTNGELRYVNNSKVDHVGYLKYQVTGLQWQTAEAVEVPGAPTAPDIEATGTYHNQDENRGSGWSMRRTGDKVEGTFTTTSSPVEYFANQNREGLVWLPAEYWPAVDKRFEVTGAVQVNREGTAIANAPTVNFWVTVRSGDGRLYYDRDAALTTAGVGYLSYSLSVEWDASPRVTVPSEPRDLEVDDVEADEVELDWRRPADDGGDAVDEYKVEVYHNGRW